MNGSSETIFVLHFDYESTKEKIQDEDIRQIPLFWDKTETAPWKSILMANAGFRRL